MGLPHEYSYLCIVIYVSATAPSLSFYIGKF